LTLEKGSQTQHTVSCRAGNFSASVIAYNAHSKTIPKMAVFNKDKPDYLDDPRIKVSYYVDYLLRGVL
jgi:hypothetical protein